MEIGGMFNEFQFVKCFCSKHLQNHASKLISIPKTEQKNEI